MKKYIVVVLIVFVGFLSSVILTKLVSAQISSKVFRMTSNKTSYIKGEPISLSDEYTNSTNTEEILKGAFTHFIFVAKENGDFYGYDSTPNSCYAVGNGINLKPGEKYLSKNKDNLFSLSQRWFASHLKNKIKTKADIDLMYPFNESGEYLVKFGPREIVNGITNQKETIEVEAVKIIIEEPTGDDLEVWKKISGENKYTFAELMRSGGFYERDQLKKSSFIKEVEQLLLEYPNSTYSTYLRSGLDNFKLKEGEKLEKEKK